MQRISRCLWISIITLLCILALCRHTSKTLNILLAHLRVKKVSFVALHNNILFSTVILYFYAYSYTCFFSVQFICENAGGKTEQNKDKTIFMNILCISLGSEGLKTNIKGIDGIMAKSQTFIVVYCIDLDFGTFS